MSIRPFRDIKRKKTKKIKVGKIEVGGDAPISIQSMTNTDTADIDLTSKEGANDAGRIIDKAIDEITIYRGRIGAFQKNAVESNLNSLRIAEENITKGESTIRDTDMASEMSKLTGNQILLSASQSMQAQANQLPENVLTLLQR